MAILNFLFTCLKRPKSPIFLLIGTIFLIQGLRLGFSMIIVHTLVLSLYISVAKM